MKPIFTERSDGSWMPGEYARGPYKGVQGGAVAALMSAAIEDVYPGFIASVSTHYLKTTPIAPLRVAVTPLRLGRRVSVIDAELFAPEGRVAVQRATLIAPNEDPDLPTPPDRPVRPEAMPVQSRVAPHGGVWFMDTMDVRLADDSVLWFRQIRPIQTPASVIGRVLAVADWAHGVVPPMGSFCRPLVAIPNADLSVHLVRAPRGEWIGLDAATAWSTASIGAGWAMLHDAEGPLGRVAMSIAITRLPEPVA